MKWDAKKISTVGLSFLLIAILVGSRVIPHVPNVTAVAAVGLLSLRWLSPRWMKYLVPLLGMIISDIFLGGFHSTSIFVFLALTLILWLNEKRMSQFSWKNLILSWLSSGLVFFAMTNLAVWWFDKMYPRSLEGLLQCFFLAIPFYWTQLAGDFLYIFSLFGLFEALRAMNQSRLRSSPEA